MMLDAVATWFSRLIDAERPAKGPPPRSLLAYMRWLLEGSWIGIGLASAVTVFAGTLEVMTALILGRVIDTALGGAPDTFFSGNAMLLLGVLAFFVILRPVSLGLMTAFQSLCIAPNVNNLVLSRLHRWTMGQAVTFFDNDFAGRIAQKQMQSARAMTDVVTEMIGAVLFGLASVIASVILMLSIGYQTTLVLAVWMCLYLALIRYSLPRIRVRAAARAAARAMVTGQVVDTVTNIKTVKLFAHQDYEDRAALNEMR